MKHFDLSKLTLNENGQIELDDAALEKLGDVAKAGGVFEQDPWGTGETTVNWLSCGGSTNPGGCTNYIDCDASKNPDSCGNSFCDKSSNPKDCSNSRSCK